MRFAIVGAAVLFVCLLSGPARGADPPAGLSPAAIERYEAELAKLTSESAGMKSAVDSLAQTVGNTNGELDGIREELKAVKTDVREMKGDVQAVRGLLDSGPAPAASVPAAKPPKSELDAIGDSLDRIGEELNTMLSDGSAVQVTLATGESMSVREFIAQWYKRPRQFPGNVDDHLRFHGVPSAALEGLSEETKQKWHAAIHELGEHLLNQRAPAAPARQPTPAAPKVAQAAPQQTASGWRVVCENGVCRRAPVAQAPAAMSRREVRRSARGG